MYLSNFECGIIVGARRASLSISQSAQLLGFSCTTISRVYKELCEKGEKKKTTFQGENALLMLEVRGEWADDSS